MRAIKVCGFVAVSVLCAASASASNMAFALRLQVGGSGQEVSSWQAELEGRPAQVLLGTEVHLTLDLENTSGRDLWMPQPFGWTNRFCGLGIEGPDGEFNARECISGHEPSAVAWISTFRTKRLFRAGETVGLTNFSFMPRCPGRYSATYWCRVPAEALNPERNGKTGKIETNDEVWQGSFQSNVVTVVVVEPEGIDEEAYEAFGRNPLGDSERYGELLRRFPTSTYAAYVVWEYGAKGIVSMPVENLVSYAAGGTSLLGNSVPDASGSWRSYSGEAFLQWRDGWFDLILKDHQQIWFGDELRFVSTLDRYLLGDKDSCAAGLEELAEHGKPYVASKAGELLSAMKAKGMLEEKDK
jgi:hypothetical protein